MPHVTFIQPAIGEFQRPVRGRSWHMQPLAIATLSALTPDTWQRTFFDDRLEPVDFSMATDLVGISVETFTAKRAYEIADIYRSKGVPVVMGGYHPTLCPDEVVKRVDAICIGEAEGIWPNILSDVQKGRLQRSYRQPQCSDVRAVYDRSIFTGKRYLKMALLETSRGCPHRCAFCSITAFHNARHTPRPVADVVAEIQNMPERFIFIVDDNVVGDRSRARSFFEALRPLGIRWVGQVSVDIMKDHAMLDLMAESGCAGLLIGFESLNHTGLASMQKRVNLKIDYSSAVAELRKRGIVVYGTFMLGLPEDTEETPGDAAAFATTHKLFLAAFNHVVPFPGTPLYAKMESEGSLRHKEWWLSDEDVFADIPFEPKCTTTQELRAWCRQARRAFYSPLAILRRAMDLRANCRSLKNTIMFFTFNTSLHCEFFWKKRFAMGVRTAREMN